MSHLPDFVRTYLVFEDWWYDQDRTAAELVEFLRPPPTYLQFLTRLEQKMQLQGNLATGVYRRPGSHELSV